jgi:prepilin-type N-terminal cleavage/methylation domain-containing protein
MRTGLRRNALRRARRGFTVVEVLVAVVVLTAGLLGLLGASALATRTMVRGRSSDQAATFAGARLERLRATACTNQASGADTLFIGGAWVAINSWSFTNAGNSTWRVQLTERYRVVRGGLRTDGFETEVSCLL